MSKSEPAGDAAPKKSKKKLIIIVAAAVLLLGGGGAGAYVMLSGGDSAPPPPEEGAVIALESMTLNLSDGHFLKLGLALQATADAAHKPDGSKALDLAIAQFSGHSIKEFSSAEGRVKAKAELLEKVQHAYHGDVMDIYFTEFVMQ